MATALAAMMPPDLHWVHDQEASKYHALPPEDDYLRLLQPKNYMPGQLDAGAACIVGAVQQLVAAQSAAEHCEPIKLFSRDAIWDTPLVIVMRKGHIRVAAWLLKFFLKGALSPELVQVYELGAGRQLVEITGTLTFTPRRSWLVWPTMLLPAAIPFKATARVGVKGGLDNGHVELLQGRAHNLPVLPSLLRAYVTGPMFGLLPHLTEPLWGLGMELLAGDEFYKQRRSGTVGDLTDTAIDYGHSPVEGASHMAGVAFEGAAGLVGRVQEMAGQAYERVAGTAQSAVGQGNGALQGAGQGGGGGMTGLTKRHQAQQVEQSAAMQAS